MKQDRHPYPFPPQNVYARFPDAVTGNEPISDLADFWLRAECPDDGQTLVPLRLLSAKIGWKVPLRSAVARLKCRQCGGRPARVTLISRADGDGKTTAKAKEIVLVPPVQGEATDSA